MDESVVIGASTQQRLEAAGRGLGDAPVVQEHIAPIPMDSVRPGHTRIGTGVDLVDIVNSNAARSEAIILQVAVGTEQLVRLAGLSMKTNEVRNRIISLNHERIRSESGPNLRHVPGFAGVGWANQDLWRAQLVGKEDVIEIGVGEQAARESAHAARRPIRPQRRLPAMIIAPALIAFADPAQVVDTGDPVVTMALVDQTRPSRAGQHPKHDDQNQKFQSRECGGFKPASLRRTHRFSSTSHL